MLWSGEKEIELGSFGGGQSRAYDLNSQAQVVGWGTDGGGVMYAFLWELGEMHKLTDLLVPGHGLALPLAEAINNNGQILAPGGKLGSTGATRWYVLNPVPELQSGIALVIGLLVTSISRRLRRRE